MKKHILYIGLSDKDSGQQEITTLDAYKIIFNLCRKYYEGGTISETRGFFTQPDGRIDFESSLILSILFADDEKTAALAEEIKTALNQTAVALEVQEINSKML